jgi:hypothetical protein
MNVNESMGTRIGMSVLRCPMGIVNMNYNYEHGLTKIGLKGVIGVLQLLTS